MKNSDTMTKYPLHITDQTGRKIRLDKKPGRIVSLVPSITYTLHRLGLDKEVVGITRFCKFPEDWKKQKSIIGGTKDVKTERIAGLQPGLIIANKEENTKETVQELEKIAPVYVSDVTDMESNARFIQDLSVILDKEATGKEIIDNIEAQLQSFKELEPVKSIYFIWREPWMSVGGDTFISRMMRYAGFDNLLKNQKRYPVVNIEELQKMQPEMILLCSEPFPFKEKHQAEMQTYFPDARIEIVEGEAFTWFGAYPEIALPYLKELRQHAH